MRGACVCVCAWVQGSVARSAAAVLAEQTRLLDTVPPATRQVRVCLR